MKVNLNYEFDLPAEEDEYYDAANYRRIAQAATIFESEISDYFYRLRKGLEGEPGSLPWLDTNSLSSTEEDIIENMVKDLLRILEPFSNILDGIT